MTDRLLDELEWRGLIHDQTPGLQERLSRGPITGYIGFDPTARSLQVGNLVPVMLLAHLQRAGHRPIVVVGGGTGLIGDPSGRSDERPLLSEEVVAANVDRQRKQFERYLDFEDGPTGAQMVDNATWLRQLQLVPFLRDIGKHFTISTMLQKESIRSRLEDGISYTEFTYMLLQAYDFLHLYRQHECEIQLGGSDQWGNITAGIDLIRRIEGAEAHGLSAPLVTTSSGKKFGKSEDGAVWLDPDLTTPYQFYQFWINATDGDAGRFLRMFTFKKREEIATLVADQAEHAHARTPQRALAYDVTARVHGIGAANRAKEASAILFGDLDPKSAAASAWETLKTELPSAELRLDNAVPNVDCVVTVGLAKSKGEARRLLAQGGLYRNGEKITADGVTTRDDVVAGSYIWWRRGKKTDAIAFIPSS